MSLGGGGLKEAIKELRELGLFPAGGAAGPAPAMPDFAAISDAYVRGMNGMFEGVGKLRETAAKLAPPAEKSAADKAFDEIAPKAVNDLYGLVRSRLVKSPTDAPAAKPSAPEVNPFAESA
jgi:hypothetical protein